MATLPVRMVIAAALCGSLLWAQTASVDVRTNPAWPKLRALIERHGLQDQTDTIVAIWMSVGGEECRKSLRAAGIKVQPATEICGVENPARYGGPRISDQAIS